jgi:subfamily B ATP-binding cassette protein MsbA
MSNEPKSGITTYKRLLKAASKHWLIFVIGITGTITMSLIDAGFTWLIKPIVNKGFINRDLMFIKWLPLIVILVFLMRGIAGFVSNYFISRVSRSVVMEFRQKLFTHMLKLPSTFYDQSNSGQLLSTIIYNVEQVASASSDVLLTVLREGSLVFGLLAVMFTVNWRLTLVFIVVTPFIAWVVKVSSDRLRRLSGGVQNTMGDVTHIASEGIDAHKVIRIYGGQRYEDDKFINATEGNRQKEMKVVVTNSLGTSAVQALISIPIAIALYFATQPALGVSAGSFAAIISAMVMILRPMRRVTMVNSFIQKGIAGAESIFSLLDEAPEIDTGKKSVKAAKGTINIDNVSFSYKRGSKIVLKNINLSIAPGETVALVGKSGSGKSTLVNLLTRFYELDSGAITLDGEDIGQYQLQSLRNQFSLVSQHTALFNDTIERNIAYAQDGKVDQQRLEDAAKSAHALEFIQELPDGFNTIVGEDGLLLSGGQRQRLSIARALYKNAPVLILDEATSALDSHSERHIQAAIDELMNRFTIIVIAHRLSTIEKADKIVVMDEGQIIETGSHAVLLKQGGAYSDLYNIQYGESDK